MQTRFPGSVQLAGQQLPGPAPHQDVPETGVHSELTNPSCHLPLPVHRGFAGDTRQRIGGHAAAHRGRAAAWGRRSAGQRTWRGVCEVDRNPGGQPALVTLAVTRGRPDRAAYVATILDLTARDYLMLTEPQPGYLICALAPASRPISSLPLSERIVASNARIRLAGLGGAPLAVLTEACSADQATYWDPFEEALKGEARRCGVTQPRLPTAVTRVLQAVAVAAGVLTFLAVHARHPGLWYPLISGFIVFVLPASWVAAARRTPRLSRAGAALAAQWRGAFANDPVAVSYAAGAWSGPAVQRLAYAVAVGIPVPGIQVPGPGSPSAAWSSRTGDWRLVPIEPPSGKRGHRLAQPGLTQFDGQVIARWMTHSSPEDEEISTWSIVVDDGGRGRSFDVRPDVYGQVRLGDLVGVRVDPRSMKLLELTPARRPPGRLVAAEEQAGLWRRQIGRA